jgi:hypothetical protein
MLDSPQKLWYNFWRTKMGNKSITIQLFLKTKVPVASSDAYFSCTFCNNPETKALHFCGASKSNTFVCSKS